MNAILKNRHDFITSPGDKIWMMMMMMMVMAVPLVAVILEDRYDVIPPL